MADFRLWPATNGPATNDTDVPISCGVEFRVTSGAWAREIRFYRGTTGVTGAVTGQLYTVGGPATGAPVAGTAVTFTLTGTGWQAASISPPVPLTVGQNYKAVVFFPSNYTATGGYWETGPGVGGIVNGLLTAPDTVGATAGQDTFTAGAAITYPTSTFHGGNFWVDVTVTDTGARTATGSGTATIGLSVSGAGSKRTTQAATATVAMVVSGVAKKKTTAGGTATITLTVTGRGGIVRDITLTATPLPSRWGFLPAPRRWTFTEVSDA